MKLPCPSLNLFLLSILLSLPARAAVTNGVGGTLTSDTSWRTNDGLYALTNHLTVARGATLTIEPGVTVLIGPGLRLTVQGRLLALGASNALISFTRSASGVTWKQLLFTNAADSVLRHCVFEYASCAGDHQDYYPTVCNPPAFAPRTNYHEAIVVLGTHLDVEHCIFRNLLGGGGGNEGDALAIVSDHPDPLNTNAWQTSSATVRHCQFLGIGQAIHTRYAPLLVEYCYFTNKHGDNDDVDLYGESIPPPLIRYNVFATGHEDKINPTRCSAIIMNNLMFGGDDHGVVLRDAGAPIVINNVITNIRNGCISVQNTCDALLANNTLVGSLVGVKLFDHTGRWGPPYCLTPGSGRVTVINCTIWDCTNSLTLADSNPGYPHSYATNLYCVIQGGTNTATRAAGSTLVWGDGILNGNPLFTNGCRLQVGSACIDTGTNLSWLVTNDLDNLPRPLDGNGLGGAACDIGAFEFLLPTADSNDDGIPDGWCWQYGLSPVAPGMADEDPDGDFQSNRQEYLAGTDPTNPTSYAVFPLPLGISEASRDATIRWSNASPAGVVSVLTATNVLGAWQPRENYYTTNPVGQARLRLESDTTFCQLLAVDLSTNNPNHYTNLLESYGILETVAGRGLYNSDVSHWSNSFEGAWATNVDLSRPHVAFGDPWGNVLIVDQRSSSVLKVTPEGRLYTYAGTHVAGFNGDGPDYATNLHLNNPNGGWMRSDGTLYILDTDNGKVRRVDTNGIMTSLFTTAPMGDGRALWVKSDESLVYFGSGVDFATTLNKWTPTEGASVVRTGFGDMGNILGDERTGALYISDRNAYRVYRLDTNGNLITIAGNGTASGSGGEGAYATNTSLNLPRSVWFIPNGGFFIGEHDPGNRIWYVDPAGIIHRWMNGSSANNKRVGDGQWFYANPSLAKVSRVRAVNTDPLGNLIITESNYGYIRRIRFQRMTP